MPHDVVDAHRYGPLSTVTDLDAELGPAPSVARSLRTGTMVLALACGGGGAWAFLAPLESAAIAPGVITVDGQRKTVQHLAGGIIEELRVRDGQHVAAGELLVRLNDVDAKAALVEAESQYWLNLARLSRLKSEQDDADAPSFPPVLLERAKSPAVARALAIQTDLFRTRRQSHRQEVAVLREQLEEAASEMAAYRAQEQAARDQLGYLAEEIAAIEELLAKGLERKPRLMDLKRQYADAVGRRDQARAQLAKVRRSVAVAGAQVKSKEDTWQAGIANELEETQKSLNEAAARLKSGAATAERTEIRAPLGGYVVGLRYFTVGGVIAAGQPILDIVPDGTRLTIEARVKPTDIDSVHVGLPARIRLTAYRQRRTPAVDGTVIEVSADRLVDSKTGEAYFQAQVQPAPGALASLPEVSLVPGMPAEVAIRTGSQRAVDYLLAPITDGMQRALVEN
jgi:HlyD family secretion protein